LLNCNYFQSGRIKNVLNDGYFYNIFSKIGIIGDGNFKFYKSFNEIIDMGGRPIIT
jgi:hypothetical protein